MFLMIYEACGAAVLSNERNPMSGELQAPTQSGQDSETAYRGRSFVAIEGLSSFTIAAGSAANERIATSREIDTHITANEFIVSWNADTPQGTGIKVEARAVYHSSGGSPAHTSRYFTLGLWSRSGDAFPRVSVKNQRCEEGDVYTDTLALSVPARYLQLRITLTGSSSLDASIPDIRFLGVSATDTKYTVLPQQHTSAAWNHEITVPARTQLGWPEASGWCSPTSTDMVLAFWAERLARPELDLPVPEVAKATYDSVYQGNGNWPFNTAFAGSFEGIRAYVSRFSDVSELEEWVVAGIPPVVSVSYDLLKGKDTDTDPGHLMVCVGFTGNGDIILNDPAYHADRGESCRRVFLRANFIRAWAKSKNALYLIYPVKHALPKNRYHHWE